MDNMGLIVELAECKKENAKLKKENLDLRAIMGMFYSDDKKDVQTEQAIPDTEETG